MYAGLNEIMTTATENVIKTGIEKGIDLRTAAYVNALNKLHEFYSLIGMN